MIRILDQLKDKIDNINSMDELEGLTIKKVFEHGNFMITVYTNNSYSVIDCDTEYNEPYYLYSRIGGYEESFNILKNSGLFNDDELSSQATYTSSQQNKQKQNKETTQRKKDMKEYLKLKEKLGL